MTLWHLSLALLYPLHFGMGFEVQFATAAISDHCKKFVSIFRVYLNFLQPSRLMRLNTPTASLQWSKTPSDGKAPVLEFWEIWSTSSLLLVPDPLCTGVVATNRVPPTSQKLFRTF